MKKAKMLGLVLAVAIVLQMFTICPVVAETGLTIDILPGQLDAIEQNELERYPNKIPTEIIPGEQIERLGHARRLPQAEGDMQTVMVGNDDGTNSLYVFSYPVKYTDSEGRIRDKSNRLSAHEAEDYAYLNTHNDIQTHLPDDITRDPVVLTYGDYAIYSMPVTEMTSSLVQKQGDGVVVYPSAFGQGTALRYQVDFSGYKEDIIIESEDSPTEFSFYIYCVGLIPVMDGGKIIYTDTDSGKSVFTTSPFYVYDSSYQSIGYIDTDSVLTQMSGSVYMLTVDVEEEFLETEGLTYPVYVDPSLSFMSTSQVETVTVYKNVTTASSANETVGYVGYRDSSYGEARMLIRFTGLRDNFIFRNMRENQINDVTMYLMAGSHGSTIPSTIRAFQFMGNSNWDRSSTWNDAGMTNTNELQSYASVTPSSGYVDFEITRTAKTWLGYSTNANERINAGIMLRCNSAANENYCRSFHTQNSGPAFTPYIVVNYTPLIEDGTYFIVNQETNHSLQANGTTAGSSVVANTYYGNASCHWTLTLQSNGYYKIQSVDSGLWLSVASNDTSGTGQVTLSTSSSGRGVQWAIVSTDDGGYILMANPAAMSADGNITKVLSLPSNSTSGGTVGQYTYVNDTNEKDEWYIGFTTRLEPQQQDQWCWAAAARMSSMINKQSIISQASAAVYVKLGVQTPNPTSIQMANANNGGTVGETESALEYILGSDNCYSIWGYIYSETTLRGLLDSTNPVIILRGWYNASGARQGGHYVVIYDYYWDANNGMYMYKIFDPWDPNVGKAYSKSYQSICNGRNPAFDDEEVDSGIWEGIVVYEKGDYLNIISWPEP